MQGRPQLVEVLSQGFVLLVEEQVFLERQIAVVVYW
jgi:hypothetical protein